MVDDSFEFPVGRDIFPSDLFVPKEQNKSIPKIREITTQSSQVSWPTFTPQSMAGPITEQIAMNYCIRTNSWQSLSTAWLSSLFFPGILIQNKRRGSEWLFSLGAFGTSAALGWPVSIRSPPTGTEVMLQLPVTFSDLQWVVCSDPEDWVAQEVRWLSPLHAMARKRCHETAQTIGTTDGEPMPLTKLAAKTAFWNFTSAHLQRLAAHYEVPVGHTLLSRISALVEHFLKPTPEEMLAILERRLQADQAQAFLGAHLRGNSQDFCSRPTPAFACRLGAPRTSSLPRSRKREHSYWAHRRGCGRPGAVPNKLPLLVLLLHRLLLCSQLASLLCGALYPGASIHRRQAFCSRPSTLHTYTCHRRPLRACIPQVEQNNTLELEHVKEHFVGADAKEIFQQCAETKKKADNMKAFEVVGPSTLRLTLRSV